MAEIEKIGGSDTKWDAATIEERRKVITELVNRPINFDVILSFAHHGKEVTCELCGNKERGGYWCKPCIHHSWCCVCCILLGIPNYTTGVYIIKTGPVQDTRLSPLELHREMAARRAMEEKLKKRKTK